MDARIAGSEQEAPVQALPVKALAVPPDAGMPSAWQIVGAVVRGTSHERLGIPCQDAEDYRVLPGGILLIALADGAGSAVFSDQGASAAVNEALHELSRSFENGVPTDSDAWQRLLRDVFTAAREAVLRLAETNVKEGVDPKPANVESTQPDETQRFQALDSQDQAPVDQAPMDQAFELTSDEEGSLSEDAKVSPGREYATTLTCAVATADRLVVGQIGDGLVVAGEGEDLFAVTHLQRGEYANETHFLTQADALDQMAIEIIERPVSALAVMSDGLIRLALKMPAQQPHAPFFQPLFRAVSTMQDEAETARQLSAFLGSDRVNARTDDDKSLVLAVRAEPRV